MWVQNCSLSLRSNCQAKKQVVLRTRWREIWNLQSGPWFFKEFLGSELIVTREKTIQSRRQSLNYQLHFDKWSVASLVNLAMKKSRWCFFPGFLDISEIGYKKDCLTSVPPCADLLTAFFGGKIWIFRRGARCWLSRQRHLLLDWDSRPFFLPEDLPDAQDLPFMGLQQRSERRREVLDKEGKGRKGKGDSDSAANWL